MTNIFTPTPMRPGRIVPVLRPLQQVLPASIFELQNVCQQSIVNVGVSQDLLAAVQRTMQLAANVKSEYEKLSEELKSQGFEEKADLISLLYKDIPVFSYYIQAIPEIKRIMFKRRQLR